MDDGNVQAVLAKMVATFAPSRVLEIGSGTGRLTLAIVRALPQAVRIIGIERRADVASAARTTMAAAGLSERVSIVVGDATRYLHKVAGPIDLIVQRADDASRLVLHDRVVRLLVPGGILAVPWRDADDKYNDRLVTDPRLTTLVLALGDGLTLARKLAVYP